MPNATREDVIAIFVSALTPYIGPAMARATARGLCEHLLLESAPLDPARIAAIIERLEPGLHVFVGQAKTPMILGQIRVAIQALGAAT